ncbi:MAG: MBL fold metallo-hydrolase [Xanthobacteraceae bacterium]
MPLLFTILGCGSSAGVPRVAQGWGACDPSNPKNRRSRCSLLVERIEGDRRTTVLVDTSPDLRAQMLGAGVTKIDGVLYTHDHADHTHGVDDLRPFFIHHRRRVDVYLDAQTSAVMRSRFGYCFASPESGEYPPILEEHRIGANEPVTIEGEGGAITALPFTQKHGSGSTLGFRFGGLAYSCDVSGLPEQSLALLRDLDVWILDALRYRPHPGHFSVEESLAWIERVRPHHAVLTNLHNDLDYATLRRALPSAVAPAFDGMKIELDR